MGLLTDVLLFPVMGPLKGFLFILNQLHKYAEKETYDITRLREKLLEARLQFERGKIGELEYKEQEEKIIILLREARERQEEMLSEAESMLYENQHEETR